MQTFYFNHHPLALAPMVNEIIAYVEQLPCVLTDDLNFKVKYIVTELLTNALKHSAMSQSFISLQVSNGYLHIIKTDDGEPLPFLATVYAIGNRVIVSQDALYRLYAIIEDDWIRFEGEELNGAIEVDDITEHFGLQIITRIADEFTYKHKAPANNFIIKLKLDLYW